MLQGRPQDLPSGQTPMRVAIFINICTYVLAVSGVRSVSNSIALAVVDVAISGLCLYVALVITDKRMRFQQAFTALCGGTVVLNMVAIPVLWLTAATDPPSFGLSDLLIMLWGLAIIAHVLRHTLEVTPLISVGLALIFYMIVLQLIALTGVVGVEPENDQQLSIYQGLRGAWLSKA